jgi:hypothetical protein
MIVRFSVAAANNKEDGEENTGEKYNLFKALVICH